MAGPLRSRLEERLTPAPTIPVVRFRAASRTLAPEKYFNWKTEIALGMRRALLDGELGLPAREENPAVVERLVREMFGVSLVEMPGAGRACVQDPSRSPDLWDAMVWALANDPSVDAQSVFVTIEVAGERVGSVLPDGISG